MASFKERSHEEEIMDDLQLDGEVVFQTLRELNIINTLLGGNAISLSRFKKLAHGRTEISLVDLGCGGGDILKRMASWTRKQGIKASYLGIDANPHIVGYAQKNCEDFEEISIEALNIFDEQYANRQFDVVHACLFVHHFTETQLIDLFKLFKYQSRLGVLINDLHRHSLAYYSIALLTSLFSKSSMVKNDAKLSVARGFKRQELIHILEQAGVTEYKLKWKWAFRWELVFR